MKLYIYKLAVVILVSMGSLGAYAQQDSISEELNKTIKVYSQPKVQLSDVVRISMNPKAYDTLDLRVDLKYSINTKPVSTAYEINQLKAVSVKGDKLQELYRGEASLGFGNYWSSFANVRYMTERSRQHQTGVDVYHYASAGKVELENGEKVSAGYSTDYIALHGKKFKDDVVLFGSFKPEFKTLHLYGVETDKFVTSLNIPFDTIFTKKETSRKILSITTQGGIASRTADVTEFRHTTYVQHDFTMLSPKRIENLVALNSQGKQKLDEMQIGYDANIQWSGLNFTPSDASLKEQFLHIDVLPKILTTKDNWNVEVGVRLSELLGVNQFKAHPHFKLDYNLKQNAVIPYVSYTGKYESYSLKEILNENPYVSDTLMLKPMNQKMNFEFGVRGLTNKNMPYKLSVSAAKVEDMHFWVNDALATDTAQNTFMAVYDDAQILSVYGETGMQNKKVDMRLSTRYNVYTLDTLAQAWHRPGLEAKYSLRYNVINPKTNRNKLVVRAEVFYEDMRYAQDGLSGATHRLDGIFDCNIGLEYFYSSILVVFLDVNNLTNTRYNRYYMYPSQRLNAMFGVTYSFSGLRE